MSIRTAENLPSPTSITHKTPSLIQTATLRLTSTRKPFLLASATPAYSVEPTYTPTVAATPDPLISKNATVEEVSNYIAQVYGAPIWTDAQATLLYQDVNGDGSKDMVYNNIMEVAIFLKQEEGFLPAYHYSEGFGQYNSSSRILFEDWTGDNVPEVVYDSFSDWGGSDLRGIGWGKSIIFCNLKECHVAWAGKTGYAEWDYYFSGIRVERVDIVKQIRPNHKISFEVIEGGFQMASVVIGGDETMDYLKQPLSTKLLAESRATYLWDGYQFVTAVKEDIASEEWIEAKPTLELNNSRMGDVTIKIEKDDPSRQDGSCTIFINQTKILDESFECKEHFTTIEWRDITSDDRPELLVRTIGADFLFVPRDCLYERLLVFDWDGKAAKNIADITGCVWSARPALFGIQIHDNDQGSPSSIKAANENLLTEETCFWTDEAPGVGANCWFELAPLQIRTFEWNGSEFVEK